MIASFVEWISVITWSKAWSRV